MERIEPELFGLDCPSFADELVRGEALEGLQSAAEVVCSDEVGEMAARAAGGFVVVAFDGRFLDGPVHSLDLAVGPRMLRLGGAMFDAELGAGIFEGVSPDELAPARASTIGVADPPARRREVGAVVGQDDVDLVRNGFDEMTQEIAGRAPLGFSMKFDEGEFARPIDSDEHVELAFGGLHLGDVDMEEADRIALELGLGSLLALYLGQTTDPVALQAAMQ